MKASKRFKLLLIIHLSAVALVLLRLCFLPFEDNLRYGIGHIVCWLGVLTAVLAFFYVPPAIRLRKWIKAYFGVYLFNSCFMALYPLAIVTLFAIAAFVPQGWRLWVAEDILLQSLIPKPVECENEHYIIRRWDDVMQTDNSKMFHLYKKEPLVERMIYKGYAGGVDYETYSAKRIWEVDEEKGQAKVEIETETGEDPRSKREIQEWEIN